MERARRFERPTLTLARLCSTPELRPLPWVRREIGNTAESCKRKIDLLSDFFPGAFSRELYAAENRGPVDVCRALSVPLRGGLVKKDRPRRGSGGSAKDLALATGKAYSNSTIRSLASIWLPGETCSALMTPS